MRTRAERSSRILDVFQPQQFFVERERAESGEVISVATVFLTNRECPWRCIYCDLWKNTTTDTVPLGAIPAQIDFASTQLWRDELRESHSEEKQPGARGAGPSKIKHIKLYNAGSFFDPKAIPPEDFPAIAERLRGFEHVIVECHPVLIGDAALRFRDLLNDSALRAPHSAIDESLVTSADTKLEVAMGLEIADDEILAKLNKRMTLQMFRRAAEFLTSNGIGVRAFVIVKPPFVRSEDDALNYARRSIDFAFDCGVSVVSLIPARFGAAELDDLAQRREFAPPKLATLESALDYGISLRRGRVFADLWDLEKFADCSGCFTSRRERLKQISLQQAASPGISCGACDTRRKIAGVLEQLA